MCQNVIVNFGTGEANLHGFLIVQCLFFAPLSSLLQLIIRKSTVIAFARSISTLMFRTALLHLAFLISFYQNDLSSYHLMSCQ